MEKMFILGIGGLVGSKLANIASDEFSISGSYNFRNPKIRSSETFQVDINNFKRLTDIIKKINPEYVINSIALTSVDLCETYSDKARKINFEFVEKLTNLSENIGAKLIHISSDSVFNGEKKSPYLEEDVSDPKNYYGETKLLSEKSALSNKNNLVVRASVLYGWLPKHIVSVESSSLKSTNFAQWLIEKISHNEKVRIVKDEYSSPIIAEDFGRTIIHLIKTHKKGIFHSAPSDCISRFDFSMKLIDYLGMNSNLIEPISVRELGRIVPTGRNKCLDSTKIQKTGFKFWNLNESFDLIKNQIEEKI